MKPAACLARYPLFALLGAQGLEAWAACGKVQSVQTGETIFEAGTPGTWAFLVLEGQVRVLRPSGPERDVSVGGVRPRRGVRRIRPAAAAPEHRHLPRSPPRPAAAAAAAAASDIHQASGGAGEPEELAAPERAGRLPARTGVPWLHVGRLVVAACWTAARKVSFPDGHTIQADGLGDDRWHFIRAGQVRLQPADGGGPSALLGPGDCFGERALLGRAGLPVAVARGEVRCLTLSRADFGPSPAAGASPASRPHAIRLAASSRSPGWGSRKRATAEWRPWPWSRAATAGRWMSDKFAGWWKWASTGRACWPCRRRRRRWG